MNLLALPAFTDNYVWMLHDGRDAVAVDPGDAAPVIQALTSLRLKLVGILVTHHHPDHVGGIDALRPLLQGPVYGPAQEVIPPPYTPVAEGQTLELLGQAWRVMDVPGHTAGHVAYLSQDTLLGEQPCGELLAPLLFCGDTLFSAGCGRLLGGTMAQLHQSVRRLGALSGRTLVCCTHEYTLANLAFAAAVEPDNDHIVSHQLWSKVRRSEGLPTLPTTLDQEHRINPFLRCAEPTVIEQALQHGATQRDSLAVFSALRTWKNTF